MKVTYYTLGVEGGNPDSMNNLAVLVEEDGVAPPPGWSLELLRNRAAQLGCADSKVRLTRAHVHAHTHV